ncbi:MAG: hypothetical protein JST28_10255 [Acidobacteria bacterium]|nr:hypothetical protein [Acidobacteriota bacterium]
MKLPVFLARSKPALLLSQIPIWTGTMILVQILAHSCYGHRMDWHLTVSWGTLMAAAYTWRPRMHWSR